MAASKGTSPQNHSGLKAVDREKICPLLLRVFCATSRHNNLVDYNRGRFPANELQIYTWMDATLKELTSLVKEVNPEARRRGTLFDIARVYPVNNQRGGVVGPNGQFLHNNLRDVGTTMSGRKGVDDGKTLKQCGFEIGDHLDIAITPPNAGGRSFDRDYQRDRDNRRNRRGFGGGRRDGRNNGDRLRPY